ncbi:ANTAR domain-containing protein [Colwellia sp. MSW7]|jgi:response regulator NasT|uniref:ANTAR domain-containing protein n=1 Tax=Colwellia maritima TaxID=2912588 RepID=A0ABS9WZ31_9GAMM|nr:ANTAR domain-containing protein [Colwellia maritima]MCI2283164.1 ANTAR domain-containing protein [Colwellia maritima]
MSIITTHIRKSNVKKHSTNREIDVRINVLLVEKDVNHKSLLTKALVDFGYQVIKHSYKNENIIEQIELYNPNILILTTDLPSNSMLKELSEVNQLRPLPIIIFAENDSPTVIKKAIKAGVSAYVVSEIHPQRIKSIISVANERFKALQSLTNELKQTKTQLESKKLIERATGLLMEQKHLNEQESYDALRKMALKQGSPIAMVAKNIIDVCSLLSAPNITKTF